MLVKVLLVFSGGVSHQLSATRLLSSPDGSRHPLDGLEQIWPWNDSYSSLHRDTYTEVRTPRPPVFTWGCFRACRARIYQSIAKRKVNFENFWLLIPPFYLQSLWVGLLTFIFRICFVLFIILHFSSRNFGPKFQVDQGVKLYNQHKQQQAVRKWKSALKAIRKREDKFVLLGYLCQAYMDWGKYRWVV